MYKTIVLALLLTLLSLFAHAHDYHASITDAKFNPRSQSLEVAIRIFTDDLESALSKRFKTKVTYSNSEKVQQYVKEYLAGSLSFELVQGKSLPHTFIGTEEEVDVVWVYLEVPLKASALSHIYIRNVVLQEIFNDQMNVVNLDYKGKVSSTLFQKSDGTKKMSF